jgi:hypothetical protein
VELDVELRGVGKSFDDVVAVDAYAVAPVH